MTDRETRSFVLRPAGLSERRCIIRQSLGWYGYLVVGGLYTFSSNVVMDQTRLIPALKYCIASHPMLGATVKDDQTERPAFIRPATIDIRQHLEIDRSLQAKASASDLTNELRTIREKLQRLHDHKIEDVHTVPPWKAVVIMLPNQDQTKRCWVVFAFAHSHGDGTSGLTFHRTLLDGLRRPDLQARYGADVLYQPPEKPLPPPLESVKLPISWSFLLAPLLGDRLPTFVSNLLGLRASATPRTVDMWTGKPIAYMVEDFRTGVEFSIISRDVLARVLAACRNNKCTLTGALHGAIVRALSTELQATSFIGTTALNLRKLIGVSKEDMGVYTSVAYHSFPRDTTSSSTNQAQLGTQSRSNEESFWSSARETSAYLIQRSSTISDQPVGLLSYLSNFRNYFTGQLGKQRDASYEISNIMALDVPPVDDPEQGCEIDAALFSQPANVTGTPVSFNVVSRKGGDLVITLTWQRGVIGVDDENAWARKVCGHIDNGLTQLAHTPQ